MRMFSLSLLTLLFLGFSGCGGGEKSDSETPDNTTPDSAASDSATSSTEARGASSTEQPANMEEPSKGSASSPKATTESSPGSQPSVTIAGNSTLKYIPEDAAAAIILRPAKALNNPIVKEIYKLVEESDPSVDLTSKMAEFEKETGIKPEQVDHVLVIVDEKLLAMAPMLMGQRNRRRFGDIEQVALNRSNADLPSTNFSTAEKVAFQPGAPARGGLGQQPPNLVVVVQLVPGVDSQKILDSLPSKETIDIAGGKAIVGPNGNLLYRVDESRLILSSKENLDGVLKNSKGGTVAGMLQKCAGSDFAVALDLAPVKTLLQGMQKNSPNAALGMLMPVVTQLQTLSIAADLEAANLLQLSVDTPNADAATGVQGALNGYLGMGKAKFEQSKGDLGPEMLPLLQQVVDGTAISTTGTLVSLTIPRPDKFETLPELLKPAFAKAATAADRSRSMNHLKMIGLAFHNYHDTFGHFPATDSNGEENEKNVQGKGLSWRVHLLPFLNEEELYEKFKLDEPWDSEHNKALIAEMPDVFGTNPEGKTAIHVFVGEGLMFEEGKPGIRIRDITDGTSNTILAVSAGNDTAEIWTKPGGLKFNSEDPLKVLGNTGEFFQVLMADGSTRNLFMSVDKKTFSNLVQPQDGNRIGNF